MHAMHYKIDLPIDYDMNIIKNRIQQNGYKTDKFEDLLFKAYLVTEEESGALSNSYCPLYVWKKSKGMTKFIFDGFFDNIIHSFGWKQIEIGITYHVDLGEHFQFSRFVVEEYTDIPAQKSLQEFTISTKKENNELAKVVIYNPDKWKYVTFTFFENQPTIKTQNQKLYSILHLSLDK
ncbi:DUF4865 family protein [Orbaceae bacterium ac157xtp]